MARDGSEARGPVPENVVPLPRRRSSSLGGRLASVPEPAATIWPGPAAGLIAGGWAAIMSLLIVAFVVLVAWIFAPLGSGQFGDAMRVAGAGWLIANGGSLTWDSAVLGLPPLLVTLLIVLLQRRAARWLVDAVAAPTPVGVLPGALFAMAAAMSVQVVVAVSIEADGITTPLWRDAVGALVVAAIGFGSGVIRELDPTWPPALVLAARALRSGLRSLLAVALVLVLGLGVTHHSAFAGVLSAVAGDGTSVLQVLALDLLYLPTAVLWALAVLLGPGIAVGAGTTVSLGAVVLGPLPPVPLLALLPATVPAVARWLLVLPAIIAFVMALRLRGDRSLAPRALTVLLATVAGGLLALAADGGVGPGRLVDTGPVWWRAALAFGGWVLGALLVEVLVHRARVWWAGRSGEPAA